MNEATFRRWCMAHHEVAERYGGVAVLAELDRARRAFKAACDRIVAQSDLLGQRAEKTPAGKDELIARLKVELDAVIQDNQSLDETVRALQGELEGFRRHAREEANPRDLMTPYREA